MIISVINQKGGVGKTTTAINVSVCVAQQQQSVLLVDLDPQGNTTSGLGLGPLKEPTLYQCLISATTRAMSGNSATIAEIDRSENANSPTVNLPTAHSAATKGGPQGASATRLLLPTTFQGPVESLRVVGASADLAGSEIDLSDNERRDDLKSVLKELSADFPLIFIDTPPSLSLLTINALVAADYLIIPVQCEYFALEGLGHLLRTLELVKKSLNPNLQILGLARTMYDGRLSLSAQVSQELEKHFPQLLFKTAIPRNVRLAEAPSHGQPITLYDKRSPGADAYRRLTVEIMQRLGATYNRNKATYEFADVFIKD